MREAKERRGKEGSLGWGFQALLFFHFKH